MKPYALIAGTVWGPDATPVYGVKVKIRRADQKKAKWEVYSDRQGEFFQRVPAGPADYVVWTDDKAKNGRGHEPDKSRKSSILQPVTRVTVHVNYDERADTSLHLTE